MREGWIKVTLGDIAKVKGGKRVPKGYKLTTHRTPYPYITVSDFTDNGTINTSNLKYINNEIFNKISRYTISSDDLYLSIAGTIGKAGLIPRALDGANLTENACKLVLSDVVSKRFLYYFTKSDDFIYQVRVNTRVAAQPKLSLERLKTISLGIPPLPEQKCIVAILEEAFAGIDTAIANTEKNLTNARELFESYLNAVFSQRGEGWQIRSVGEFAEHCLGKMLDKQKNKGEKQPYLRNVNVQWFQVYTDDVLEMRIEAHEEDRFAVDAGDLLICEGGYPGRAAIWEDDKPMFFQKALHRVRCKDPRLNHWLLYYLYFSDSNGELSRHFTGAGIQHFTGKALKAFRVPLPPPKLINGLLSEIGAVHNEVVSLESIYRQKLSALTELKQSLLQKAFSGELTADKSATVPTGEEESVA